MDVCIAIPQLNNHTRNENLQNCPINKSKFCWLVGAALPSRHRCIPEGVRLAPNVHSAGRSSRRRLSMKTLQTVAWISGKIAASLK